MKSVSAEKALEMIEAYERKRLESLTREELLERVLSKTMYYVDDLELYQLANRLIGLSNGEFSVIRTDLGEKE